MSEVPVVVEDSGPRGRTGPEGVRTKREDEKTVEPSTKDHNLEETTLYIWSTKRNILGLTVWMTGNRFSS